MLSLYGAVWSVLGMLMVVVVAAVAATAGFMRSWDCAFFFPVQLRLQTHFHVMRHEDICLLEEKVRYD
jgi:hypothetical protein